MGDSYAFWIDANVLITAKNGPFRFGLAPAFWKAIDEHSKAGSICQSKLVYDEIVRNVPDDELAKWLRVRRTQGFCITPGRSVQQSFQRVADHVQGKYSRHHAAVFLQVADPWVVAHALDDKGAVVTFESKQPNAKKVKIPNVCEALGVRYVDLYDMLEELQIRFN